MIRGQGAAHTWWTTSDLLLGLAIAIVGPPFAVVFRLSVGEIALVLLTFASLVPAVAARRTRPAMCVCGCATALVVLVIITPMMSLHVALVIGVGVHTAASRLPARWVWSTIGLVIAVILADVAIRPRTPGLVIGAVLNLVVVAVAALTGLLSRRERERIEYSRVLKRSEERAAVARELHDVVAHSLGVIAVQADGARYMGSKDPEATQEALERIGDIARSSLGRARAMVVALRSQNDELAFGSDGFAQIAEVIRNTERAGTTVRATLPDTWPEADMMVQSTVNRIVTEGLSNAMRHGSGSVSVEVQALPTSVVVELCNAYSGSSKEAGIGLVGLRERAQLVGGRLESASDAAHHLWRLSAEVPLTWT